MLARAYNRRRIGGVMSEAEKHAYTLPLADVRATLERVGGKGASLARLVRAGLPVPDGFHVTTTAYRDFVDANNIQALIESALHPVDVKQPHTLEAGSEQIRSAFARGAVPGEIAQAIGDAYRQLGDVPVAVRSSATAEDLPGLSFAGQQETFLNMRGSSAVLDAVKRCWASLWTARAIGYRAQHQIDQQHVSLAVVVQQLVPAEAAGVLFTANPMNGDRQQIVMNAVWGLGEAMVSGLVTPDSLVLDKTMQQVLTRQTSDKQLMTARAGSGTFEQPVPDAQRRAPVLDDAAAAELARLGVRIEQLYGRPVDVEWTRAAGIFNIVQARPITALREPELPAPTQWRLPDPKAQYYRASIVELLPDPLTPLFATLGRAAINHSYKRFADAVFGDAQAWPSDILVTLNDYAFYGIRTTARLLGAAGRALSRLVPM
ncbi:MAG TPA: PEP/pyruvate-binding domain-containing protein, partial [Chloroflexota bacterium]|nr:PEP/pyruvate-binding domain-containing protein [Chloroflexota bacterium]